MTREEKSLLLRDLCTRLPYRVKVKVLNDNEPYTLLSVLGNKGVAVIGMVIDGMYATSKVKIEDCKPYLRSMEDMTDEEIAEFYYLQEKVIYNSKGVVTDDVTSYIDFLLKNHFDYRGFIEKSLAIEVTEENNPYKD